VARFQALFSLATVLLSLTAATAALAEPPARIPYANPGTGECGLFITSSKDEQRTLLDPGFRQIGPPWTLEECKRLQERRTAFEEQLGEAATKAPCGGLALSRPTSPEQVCKALGYRYVGEVPVSIRPCYPTLGLFLGASCAPLIWIHLAVLIGVLGFFGALAYVMLTRRAKRRRALAAAARDAPPRSQAYR